MSLNDLLRRALDTNSQDDQVRFMAEVGRLIARRLRAIDMWDVGDSPHYFGYQDIKDWNEVYPRGFEANLVAYATAQPTVDFFVGANDPESNDKDQAEHTQGNPQAPRRRRSPFEEAFTEGGRLAAMMRLGDEIAGYLATMVNNFLIERQRHHDPIGYRVFKNLEAVVQELEEEKMVEVADRQGPRQRIRRSSLVRFRNTNVAQVGSGNVPLLETVVSAPILVGSVHKLAKLGRGAQCMLRQAVIALPAAGITDFQFGDLLTPLQKQVREAHRVWNATPALNMLERDRDHRVLNQIRIFDAVQRYSDEAGSVESLVSEIRAAIDAGGYQERTRVGLHKILDDLLRYRAQGQVPPPLTEWAIRLGVRRATLWDHWNRLKIITDQVQAKRAENGQ
jgi:hypothetical protein